MVHLRSGLFRRLLPNRLTAGQGSPVALQRAHGMTGFQRAEPFGRRRHPLLTNGAVVPLQNMRSEGPGATADGSG